MAHQNYLMFSKTCVLVETVIVEEDVITLVIIFENVLECSEGIEARARQSVRGESRRGQGWFGEELVDVREVRCVGGHD